MLRKAAIEHAHQSEVLSCEGANHVNALEQANKDYVCNCKSFVT